MKDTSGGVGAYAGLASSLARKYVGRNGAELDDLIQEGLIAAWQVLERGHRVTAEPLEWRMRKWVRYLGRLNGRGNPDQSADYAQLLPLDDFRNMSLDIIPLPKHDALT